MKKNADYKRQHNTDEKQQPILTHNEAYHDGLFSYRVKPVDQDYLKKLALEILEWAENDKKALKITQFYNTRRIHHSTFEGWMERCPELKEAHDMVLQILGTRRELGGIARKFDPTMIQKTMAMYDPKWKEIEAWRSKMSGNLEDTGPRMVIIEKFPEVTTTKTQALETEVLKKIESE